MSNSSSNLLVILLTGTIQPENVPSLELRSPKIREMEYANSIKKWLSLGFPVVFCENSNFSSDIIDDIFSKSKNKKSEYLKFNTAVSYKGKGNGEAEIIQHAFKQSRILNNASLICKATGKNFVKNSQYIIKEILKTNDENTLVISNLCINLSYADSRFFFFRPFFYMNFLERELTFINEKDKYYFEHALAKSIHLSFDNNKSWQLLPSLPKYNGYYGTQGVKYRNNIFMSFAKSMLFQLKRKLLALHF